MALSEGFTKSQIDRLGDRLRKSDISEADLRLLDTYRRSFADASEYVFAQIRDRLGLEPAGRATKSTTSIVGKLRREKTRLSRMQDIAGCRLLADDVLSQDVVVENVLRLFEKVTVVDRRERPSHGYRAVHVVVHYSGKLVEVQVRTALQQLWAELSEKLSDLVDTAIKYGGGDEDVVRALSIASRAIERQEAAEVQLLQSLLVEDPQGDPDVVYSEELKAQDIRVQRLELEQIINALGDIILRSKGRKDDLSD